MDFARTVLLGLVAGGTIAFGLPVGRLRRPVPQLRTFLSASAVGVLLFLVWDVLAAAWEPVDARLTALHSHAGSLAPALGFGALFGGGIALGLLSLVAYDRWMARRHTRAAVGPGTMAAAQRADAHETGSSWSPARQLSLLIAVGIGLHNFAEGLAIGQAAAGGAVGIAVLLVIGFALHNATEGFGIVAPLAADLDDSGCARRPSWAYLGLMGLIGGGPTFLGTAIGHSFSSEPVSVIFLTLAAGSILFVVMQLLGIAARAKRPDLVAYGVLLGLLAGFATDAVVTAAGV